MLLALRFPVVVCVLAVHVAIVLEVIFLFVLAVVLVHAVIVCL